MKWVELSTTHVFLQKKVQLMLFPFYFRVVSPLTISDQSHHVPNS